MGVTAHTKHSDLIIRQAEPFNGGPPPDLLIRQSPTPNELFFVRNHGAVPAVDAAGYRLRLTGRVERPLDLSLEDLRRLPRVSVPATLQCAGNRRRELLSVREIPGEVPWDLEAISHAEWGGVRLAEVLRWAGIDERAAHVAFTGLDEVTRHGRTFGFGGSIPLAKALADEVLLADEMNGRPLPPAHGGPLRLVVPGYIGARSVKWLGEIAVQDEPSANYFQQIAYRLLLADAGATGSGRMLDEVFATAAICSPLEGEAISSGSVRVRGYALGHGGAPVARVELSADDGHTWQETTLRGESRPWSWRLWEGVVSLVPGNHTLAARAIDTNGRAQPADLAGVWNAKGYMNNAWHRVVVRVRPA